MSAATNKALIERLTDSFNKQEMAVLDELIDCNYVDHGPFPGQPPGIAGIKEAHALFYKGFPDVHETIDDIFAEDDRVVVRWTCTGTHLGEFAGMRPTGKRVVVTGIDIYRLANDKVVENWHNVDATGLLYQIGVYSPVFTYIASVVQWLKYRLWGKRTSSSPNATRNGIVQQG